jgi:sporulation protein YlmC with PRC-barrel domain
MCMPPDHSSLRVGAPVYSTDSEQVGSLERVLVDSRTMELRQIVVKESPKASGHHWYQGGNMLIHDVIVPADEIRGATEERIDLDLTLSEVRHLPPYLSYQYVGASPGQTLVGLAGGLVWPYAEKTWEPAGELEVRRGENVMFKYSGTVLGNVHDLVYDNDELVGVIVRLHGLIGHEVLLQARFLDRSDDAALFAHITEQDLKHLRPTG